MYKGVYCTCNIVNSLLCICQKLLYILNELSYKSKYLVLLQFVLKERKNHINRCMS